MSTERLVCVQCGNNEEGFIGPIEPDVENPGDPPASGFYRILGPSYGLRFSETNLVCSEQCGIAFFNGDEPTGSGEIKIKGWKQLTSDSGPTIPPEKKGIRNGRNMAAQERRQHKVQSKVE